MLVRVLHVCSLLLGTLLDVDNNAVQLRERGGGPRESGPVNRRDQGLTATGEGPCNIPHEAAPVVGAPRVLLITESERQC